MSRIYYHGKFYDYPLVPMNALRNLGFVEAVRCVGSYAVGAGPPAEGPDDTRGLHRGALRLASLPHTSSRPTARRSGASPATEIQADLGAQRIKNLSLFRAVWEALKPKKLRIRRDKSKQVTSLIEEFNYPKYGPGMMWERCTEIVTGAGHEDRCSTSTVTKVEHDGRPGHRRDRGDRRRCRPATSAPTSSRRCRSARCCGRWTRRRRPTVLAAAPTG